MNIFTKLFCGVALCMGAVATYAQENEEVELTAEMFQNWNGYGADASPVATATVDFNIGNDADVNAGGVVCGTSTVDYLIYADLSGSIKMKITGTAGMQLRVLMNRQESNSGPLVEKNCTIGDEGAAELDLSDLDYVHVNAIKAGWSSPAGKIASIKLVKPSDPLAAPKEALKSAIARAKMITSLGKTQESFNALQAAIENAETALANESVTEAELQAVTTALAAAADAVELAPGYTALTADMFKSHTAQGEEGTTTACAYVLFEATGLPYGDGNVGWLNYADLSNYDQLIVAAAAGTPRFCMNRTEDGAQDNDDPETSKFIDIPGHGWGTEAYQTKDGDNVWVINLAKLVEDRGIAYLHSIKGANWANVTVTDMLLFKNVSTGVQTLNAVGSDANVIFDLQGRRVAQPTKGLYIMNGKKTIIR